MMSKKLLCLVIVLSLAFTLLPKQDSALACNTTCPAGTSLVAKYNWAGGRFVLDSDSPSDVITFLPWKLSPLVPYNSRKGRWVSSVLIDVSVIADGKVYGIDVTHTYLYKPPVYKGYYNMADTGYAYKDISNIIFCAKNYAVSLASFTAQANRGLVTLKWGTASEVNNAGFILYRSRSADGDLQQISPNLIAAQGDGVTGASYAATDVPGYGTFYYWLEDVDFSGKRSLHGPVKVEVTLPVRLPTYMLDLPGH